MRFCVQPFNHMTPRFRPGNLNSFQHLNTYTKRGDTPGVHRSRHGLLIFIVIRAPSGKGVDAYDFQHLGSCSERAIPGLRQGYFEYLSRRLFCKGFGRSSSRQLLKWMMIYRRLLKTLSQRVYLSIYYSTHHPPQSKGLPAPFCPSRWLILGIYRHGFRAWFIRHFKCLFK
jgi:hypothetical protein